MEETCQQSVRVTCLEWKIELAVFVWQPIDFDEIEIQGGSLNFRMFHGL